MSKRTHTRRVKRPRVTRPPRQVTRYEFAEVVLRLSQLETLVNRNRTDLDIQFTRIVQLQDQIDALTKLQPPATISALPIQPKPTIERSSES
jgi:hypothetical protein